MASNQPKRQPFSEQKWREFKQANARLAEAFRPFFNEYRALIKRLRGEGFRINSYTFMA